MKKSILITLVIVGVLVVGGLGYLIVRNAGSSATSSANADFMCNLWQDESGLFSSTVVKGLMEGYTWKGSLDFGDGTTPHVVSFNGVSELPFFVIKGIGHAYSGKGPWTAVLTLSATQGSVSPYPADFSCKQIVSDKVVPQSVKGKR